LKKKKKMSGAAEYKQGRGSRGNASFLSGKGGGKVLIQRSCFKERGKGFSPSLAKKMKELF